MVGLKEAAQPAGRPDRTQAVHAARGRLLSHAELYGTGRQPGGEREFEAACFRHALELRPESAPFWVNFALAGGGTMGGQTLSPIECFRQALELAVFFVAFVCKCDHEARTV